MMVGRKDKVMVPKNLIEWLVYLEQWVGADACRELKRLTRKERLMMVNNKRQINGSARLCVAFIAIGAADAVMKKPQPELEKLIEYFEGVINLIDCATDTWWLVELLYDNLRTEERDLFGCWDYEVSKAYGAAYINAMSELSYPTNPTLILRDIVCPQISEERFNEVMYKTNA